MVKASTNINNQPHLKSLSIKQTTTNGVENTGWERHTNAAGFNILFPLTDFHCVVIVYLQ